MPIHGSRDVTASREGGVCAGQSRFLPVHCVVLCFLPIHSSGNCTLSLWRTIRMFKQVFSIELVHNNNTDQM